MKSHDKDNKYMKITVAVLLSVYALLLISCPEKNRVDRGIKAQRAEVEGRPASGMEAGRPQHIEMSEAASLLIKLDALISNENPVLTLTGEQKRELTPTLMEWREELQAGDDKASAAYAVMVENILNKAQREYKPEAMGPPGFGEGERPQGPPPQGVDTEDGRPEGHPMPPAPPDDRELLDMVIDRLT